MWKGVICGWWLNTIKCGNVNKETQDSLVQVLQGITGF